MPTRIRDAELRSLQERGNPIASLCLGQRKTIVELRALLAAKDDSKAERTVRDLQAHIDRLNAEIARLKSNV